jgi:hypothetical protein
MPLTYLNIVISFIQSRSATTSDTTGARRWLWSRSNNNNATGSNSNSDTGQRQQRFAWFSSMYSGSDSSSNNDKYSSRRLNQVGAMLH